jgi:regulator of replication initiation timing
MLRGYLEEQKALTASAKERLVRFTQEDENRNGLEAIIGEFKAATQDKGKRVFTELRNFQRRLGAFKKEQKETNHEIQRLLDRGASLRLEDMRLLEAARDRQERKAERELRREEMERLLSHFNQQRQRHSRYWQW